KVSVLRDQVTQQAQLGGHILGSEVRGQVERNVAHTVGGRLEEGFPRRRHGTERCLLLVLPAGARPR
ncbi:MAG TPA: hypothetical protein VFO52_12915, partial [Longimicrobiales bacterium]|nr:hypothetical protein [Longimicrobiales bacterium]